mgnify:CR=1 FL=1
MKNTMMLVVAVLCFSFSIVSFAVNVNTATAEEIAKELKGVGAAKAEAIVLYRQEHGAFKSLKELTKVKGIGASTIDKNRESLELDAN